MQYLYYYRAEDMWENVAYVPPEGPVNPWTFYSGAIDKSVDSIHLPSSFGLTIYPNPFNAQAEFILDLSRSENVRVEMYDVLGRLQRIVASERMRAGDQKIRNDGYGLASGIYFLNVKAGEKRVVKKVVMMK